jgi:hypothetical protein
MGMMSSIGNLFKITGHGSGAMARGTGRALEAAKGLGPSGAAFAGNKGRQGVNMVARHPGRAAAGVVGGGGVIGASSMAGRSSAVNSAIAQSDSYGISAMRQAGRAVNPGTGLPYSSF